MAKYEEIAASLKHQIKLNVYKEGEMIPPEYKICKLYGVSRITVRQALDILVREKYLTRERGRGKGTKVLSSRPVKEKVRRQLNYGVAFALSQLNSQKSDVPDIIHGITGKLNVWEASMSTFPFNYNIDQVELFKSLLKRNLVDGFFMFTMLEYTEGIVRLLLDKKMPLVVIVPSDDHDLEAVVDKYCLNSVRIDEISTVKELLARAAKANIANIRIIGVRESMSSRTLSIFRECAGGTGQEISFTHVDPQNNLFSQVKKCISGLDKSNTLLVVGENGLLPYTDAALDALSMRAPEDIQVLAFRHYSHIDPLIEDRYSVIERPFYELGKKAAEIMINMDQKKRNIPVNICLKSMIKENGSMNLPEL